MNYITRYRLP